MYKLLVDFISEPIAWGSYQIVPDTHFLLCKSREVIEGLPSPRKFVARLAVLHQNSKSLEDKFSSHLNNYMGNLSLSNKWEENL